MVHGSKRGGSPHRLAVAAATAADGARVEGLERRWLLAADALDVGFDHDGGRNLSFADLGGLNMSAYGYAVAVGPDGRTFVAGDGTDSIAGGNRRAIVAAFLPDGTPDPAFGNGGRIMYTPNTSYMPAYNAVAVQPDGKIVVAGVTGGTSRAGTLFVARLGTNGTADTSFSGDGVEYLAAVKASVGITARVESDGTVLYAYADYAATGTAANTVTTGKLTPYGVPDARFGNAGVFAIADPPDGPSGTNIYRIALQADGKAVLAGQTNTTSRIGLYVLRLDTAPAGGQATLDANGVLHITGTDRDDSVEVLNTFAGQIRITINGHVAGAFPFAQVRAIAADLLGGDDLLTLRQTVFAPLVYDGNDGRDALIFEASNGSDSDPVINATHVAGGGNDATFSGVEDLTVDAKASNDTVVVDVGTDFPGTLLVEGNDQNDRFDVRTAPTNGTSVTLSGGNGDDVFLFGPTTTAWVTVEGGSGTDRVSMTGSAAQDLVWAREAGVQLDGGAASYAGVESIDIGLGDGDDIVSLYGAQQGTRLAVDGGAGDDDFTFAATAAYTSFYNNPTSITGGDGADGIRLATPLTTSQTFAFTPTRLTWAAGGLLADLDATTETITVIGGGAADRFDVTPSPTASVFFDAANPTTAPGDVLILVPGGATGITRTGNQFTFDNRLPVEFQNVETVTPSDTPPVATSAAFDPGRRSVTVDFSEDVMSSVAMGDLQLSNLSTNQAFAASLLNTRGGAGIPTSAEWAFPSLPNGLYRATLPAASIGDAANNRMPAEYVFNFILVNDGGTVTLQGTSSAPVVVQQLSLGASSATLDLGRKVLLVRYADAGAASPAAALAALLAGGSNRGRWTGAGIVSAAAAGDTTYVTGVG
jgi:uncharacterized delta-60 repeat protein